jgi:hypothetical protein
MSMPTIQFFSCLVVVLAQFSLIEATPDNPTFTAYVEESVKRDLLGCEKTLARIWRGENVIFYKVF